MPSPSGVARSFARYFREELGVVPVDLRHVRNELGLVLMVRQRMMRLGHANLRIRPRALLLADHERNHAREIALIREQLQVEHQRQVIFENRRCSLRLIHFRQLEIGLLLRALDAALDVSHRFRVLLDLRAILRPQLGSAGSPAFR